MTETTKKRKKKPHPLLDYLFYLLIRVIALFLQLFDVNATLRLARTLGTGLYLIYHRGRNRALEHLRLSFPEKSPAWHHHTARRSFQHIVMLAFDVLYTSRLLTPSTWHRYIEFDDISQVLKLILHGRGIIMLTGHYGNFEVCGYAMAVFGLHSYSVGRPIDNPYINRYLLGVRQRHGQIIIDKKGATPDMLKALESHAILNFIADQNAGHKGIFVDFFGRKASTYKSIGLLAMEYNLPIVIGYARRLHDQYRFRLGVAGILHPHQWQDQPHPLRWITAQYTAAIEQLIREDPQQYWWIHRRWKTRPPDELKPANP